MTYYVIKKPLSEKQKANIAKQKRTFIIPPRQVHSESMLAFFDLYDKDTKRFNPTGR
jgi:hypothetical protein